MKEQIKLLTRLAIKKGYKSSIYLNELNPLDSLKLILLQDWLREQDIHISITYHDTEEGKDIFQYTIEIPYETVYNFTDNTVFIQEFPLIVGYYETLLHSINFILTKIIK